MILSNGKYKLDLEITEDAYWLLIKTGAQHKMHIEEYAESVLENHVLLNRQTAH
jgi:hypothetical protein